MNRNFPKINIVTEKDSWILRRISREVANVTNATISDKPSWSADINYFVNYGYIKPVRTKKAAFFTHRDPELKNKWKEAEKSCDLTFYMASRYKPKHKHAYQVVPAGLDSTTKPRLKIAVIGRVYKNRRKGERHYHKLMDIQNIDWYFVGQDWKKQGFEPISSSTVRFIEEFPGDDNMKKLYKNVDIVLCLADKEGGPIPNLEASKLNANLFSTNVGNTEIWAMNYPQYDVEMMSSLVEDEIHKKFNRNIVCGYSWKRFAHEHAMYFELMHKNQLVDTKNIRNNDVTIVIPVFNQRFYLQRLIQSIGNYPIVIVDDKSDDPETIDYLETLKLKKNISVYRNKYNVGFGRTCNKGVKLAKTPYVCLLNSDVEVPVTQKCWLKTLVARMKKDRNIGAICPRLLFPDHTIQFAGKEFSFKHMNTKHVGVGKFGFDYKLCRIKEYPFLCAAAVVMRKKYFTQLKGFNSIYNRGYYEDSELSLDILEDKKKIVYDGSVWLYHYHGKSFAHTGLNVDNYDNLRLFLKRNIDRIQKLC